jgi:membrane-associated phospholipid phosphatase
LLLNILMAGSSLLIGGHYLVDLLGGFAIATAMLAAAQPFGSPEPNRTGGLMSEGTEPVYQA